MNKEEPNTPNPVYSYWPILLALGILLISVGIVSMLVISVIGVLLLLTAVIGWIWENRSQAQEARHDG